MMSAQRSRFRPVAIALVLEDDSGNMHIVGSKAVESFEIEMSREVRQDFYAVGDSRFASGPRSYRFQADCSEATWRSAAASSVPARIEQRGIFLPDMSFRALPEPDELK
jgi:hypothetical protein